jgi:hypothetical protein
MDLMKNANEKLSVVRGEGGESVSIGLQAVLRRTSGYLKFSSVCQILNEDDIDPLKTLLLRKFLC